MTFFLRIVFIPFFLLFVGKAGASSLKKTKLNNSYINKTCKNLKTYEASNDNDEIISKNKTLKTLLAKVEALYKRKSYEDSNIILLKSIEIIKNNENHFSDLGYCYFKLGNNYRELRNEKKALENYSLAKFTYSKTNRVTQSKALNLLALANLYNIRYRFAESSKNLNKALDLVSELEDKVLFGKVYTAFAELQTLQGNFEKAFVYFDEIEKLYAKSKNNETYTKTKINKARLYCDLKQYDKADSILSCINYKGAKKNKFMAYANLLKGEILLNKKELKKALALNFKGRNLYKTDISYRISYDIQRSKIYRDLGNNTEAIKILERSIDSVNKYDRFVQKKDILRYLADLHENNNNMSESNKYLTSYINLNDSLVIAEKASDAEFYKVMFDVEKNKINLEKKENELKYLSDKSKTKSVYNIILLICLVLLAFLTGAFLIKQKRLHQSKNKIQTIEKEKLQQSLDFKNRQITNFSIHIKEKNKLLENIKKKISEVSSQEPRLKQYLFNISSKIKEDIQFNKTKIELYSKIQENNDSFLANLSKNYADLSPKEQEIIQLLRLDLSSKQIASQLNLSIYSIDTYRSKIRTKMKVKKNKKLSDFVKEI